MSGQTIAGTIAAAGQLDTYSFAANAGDTFELSLGDANAQSGVWPQLTVYDPTNAVVGSYTAVSNQTAGKVLYTVPAGAGGTFTAVAQSNGSGTGPYMLEMARAPSSQTPDSNGDGGSIVSGQTITGTINRPGDIDVYTFNADAGGSFILSLGDADLVSGAWPSLVVVGPNGNIVGNSSAGFNKTSVNVSYSVPAGQGGTYTAFVQATGTSVGAYGLELAAPPELDAADREGDWGQLYDGVAFGTYIDRPGDLDTYWLYANEGDLFSVRISWYGGNYRPKYSIYEPDGALVASKSTMASNAWLASNYAVPAGQAGWYMVVVQSAGAGDTGVYALQFSNLSIATTPTIITNPQSQSVAAGENVTFTAAASGTPTPTVQWQVSTDGGVSYSPISGATSTTLELDNVTLADSGKRYQAVFLNGIGEPVTTESATLTVSTALAAYSVVLVDPSTGTPLATDSLGHYIVVPGGTFKADVYVSDLRSVGSSGGVSAAYADLVRDLNFVSWVSGTLIIAPEFSATAAGAIDVGGQFVDEAGGKETGAPPGALTQQLLFSVHGIVDPSLTPGAVVTIATSKATGAGHDTTLFGSAVTATASYGTAQLVINARPWQNQTSAYDVNNDGYINILDVVKIVGESNAGFGGPGGVLSSAPQPPNGPPPYVDVNGDGYFNVLDIIAEVSYINAHGFGPANPIGSAQHAATISSDVDDAPAAESSSASTAISAPLAAEPVDEIPAPAMASVVAATPANGASTSNAGEATPTITPLELPTAASTSTGDTASAAVAPTSTGSDSCSSASADDTTGASVAATAAASTVAAMTAATTSGGDSVCATTTTSYASGDCHRGNTSTAANSSESQCKAEWGKHGARHKQEGTNGCQSTSTGSGETEAKSSRSGCSNSTTIDSQAADLVFASESHQWRHAGERHKR